MEQGQDTLSFVFAIPAFTQEAIEVFAACLAPLRVTLAKIVKLLLVVLGWIMGRVGLPFILPAEMNMNGDAVLAGGFGKPTV